MTSCVNCDARSADTDRFCERCGADLRPKPHWLSSAAPAGACSECAAESWDAEGYCDRCGRRRGSGLDQATLELAGVAAVTDRGLRRRYNEDAVAIGAHGDAVVAVVCDGVSSSARPDTAAYAAAHAGVEELLRDIAGGASPARATGTAFDAAFAEVAKLSGPATRHNPPSCTYVSAVVTGVGITVGWVGDSRAYWVPAAGGAGARCLTVDDSVAGLTAEEGTPADSRAVPHASALIRWVGADAGATRVRVATLDQPPPGNLIVCSDGLSRYLAGPQDLAMAVDEAPAEAARRLTRYALDAGGADNIAIAVVSFPLPTG